MNSRFNRNEMVKIGILNQEESNEVKQIILGDVERTFSEAWSGPGFVFKSFPPYALEQKKCGPCGVIAAVQAFLQLELTYGKYRVVLNNGLLRPTYSERLLALSSAISRILLRAKTVESITLVQKCGEFFKKYNLNTGDELCAEVHSCISMFTGESGLISFLYSLILTRGVDNIKEDFVYYENNSLIGTDSYSSQELINLILVGKAVPNVFDGDRIVDGIVLKGIPERSEIGFLSLSDYEENDPVGDYYKCPKYPIWVLNAIHHYYIICGLKRNILVTDEPFNLLYVDNLLGDYELNITIDTKTPHEYKDLEATVRCIHTKWPSAKVEVKVVESD